MSEPDVHFIGPDGVVGINLDQMLQEAFIAAARIAVASGDRDGLASMISRELARPDLHPAVHAAFVALVVQSLAGDIFAPLLSYVQVRELDHDFLAELRHRTGEGTESGDGPDSNPAEQGGPNDGPRTIDGR